MSSHFLTPIYIYNTNMDVNSVLSQLIINDASFPALKLAWDCQIDVKEDLPKISPSHYLTENQLTTEERLSAICKQQRKISCRKPGAEVIVEPAMIVFQNYKFGDSLGIPITIRNISKGPQKVTLLMDETSVFKFDESSQRILKFPCGMSMSATVRFNPDDDRDYYHKLVIRTNQTRFAIPIIAIGARGLLNAPDSILFENIPVKYFKTKTIPVCNLGNKPAKFVLFTTGPFCVKPEKGVVQPRENFSMEVSHYSATCNVSIGQLIIKYDNGEEVFVHLLAQTVNEDVKLYPEDALCDDTYMGMKTKFLCTIQNNGNTILDFKWTKHATPMTIADKESFDLANTDLEWRGGGHNLGRAIGMMENCEDCIGIDMDVEDQIIALKGSSAEETFTNENFLIEPVIGKVQPYSTYDVYIIFSPVNPGYHSTIAYLDITGAEDRIPLTISGKALGPKFKFGFETMELGTILLGGNHSFEIPVLNISEIPGKIDFDSLITNTSGISMNVEPKRLQLSPDEHGAFYLNFVCIGKLGDFEEMLKFIVKNTEETMYITIKGAISCPSVRFTENEAFIGQVSYAFPQSYEISLINDSMNFVDVTLKMDEDGGDPQFDYQTILDSFQVENFELNGDPAEFSFVPSSFKLHPRGMQRVTITLCAKKAREIIKSLICYQTDSDGNAVEELASQTVIAHCVVPCLRCEIADLRLVDCYPQFPYASEFSVMNPSDLPVCYCIIPQMSTKIRIQSNCLVGVAKPGQVTSIPFDMICETVGRNILAYFDLYTVGRDEKLFTFSLKVDCIPAPKPQAS